MFSPAMMAISELKLPTLKHSRAVSIQNSMIFTRCFFFECCDKQPPGYIYNFNTTTTTIYCYSDDAVTLHTSDATR